MAQTFKKKVIRKSLISLGVIAVFATVIIVLNEDMHKRVARIEARKSDLALKSSLIEILSELKAESVKARPLHAQLQGQLPSRDELIGFPRALNEIANTTHVGLGFTFGTETASSDTIPGSTRFIMTLEGGYSNIVAFLSAFEKYRYYTTLSSFEVNRKDGGWYALSTSGEVFTR